MHALTRSVYLSTEIGLYAVVVDALDEKAKSFYQRFGFGEFSEAPMSLLLPINTIKASMPNL